MGWTQGPKEVRGKQLTRMYSFLSGIHVAATIRLQLFLSFHLDSTPVTLQGAPRFSVPDKDCQDIQLL